jgi:hypothetical protein
MHAIGWIRLRWSLHSKRILLCEHSQSIPTSQRGQRNRIQSTIARHYISKDSTNIATDNRISRKTNNRCEIWGDYVDCALSILSFLLGVDSWGCDHAKLCVRLRFYWQMSRLVVLAFHVFFLPVPRDRISVSCTRLYSICERKHVNIHPEKKSHLKRVLWRSKFVLTIGCKSQRTVIGMNQNQRDFSIRFLWRHQLMWLCKFVIIFSINNLRQDASHFTIARIRFTRG